MCGYVKTNNTNVFSNIKSTLEDNVDCIKIKKKRQEQVLVMRYKHLKMYSVPLGF